MKRKGKRVLLDMREKTFEALTWKKTKKKKKKKFNKRGQEQLKKIGENGQN